MLCEEQNNKRFRSDFFFSISGCEVISTLLFNLLLKSVFIYLASAISILFRGKK